MYKFAEIVSKALFWAPVVDAGAQVARLETPAIADYGAADAPGGTEVASHGQVKDRRSVVRALLSRCYGRWGRSTSPDIGRIPTGSSTAPIAGYLTVRSGPVHAKHKKPTSRGEWAIVTGHAPTAWQSVRVGEAISSRTPVPKQRAHPLRRAPLRERGLGVRAAL